jgi:hypothetical protein
MLEQSPIRHIGTEEVLTHLAGLVGAKVRVKLQIEAEIRVHDNANA